MVAAAATPLLGGGPGANLANQPFQAARPPGSSGRGARPERPALGHVNSRKARGCRERPAVTVRRVDQPRPFRLRKPASPKPRNPTPLRLSLARPPRDLLFPPRCNLGQIEFRARSSRGTPSPAIALPVAVGPAVCCSAGKASVETTPPSSTPPFPSRPTLWGVSRLAVIADDSGQGLPLERGRASIPVRVPELSQIRPQLCQSVCDPNPPIFRE